MDPYAALYRRWLDGDEKAFAEIVNDLRDGLVFFIDRYLHDYAAAEDAAIDCFADLLLRRRGYNGRASLKTYLYLRGRSRALDLLRHRKALRELPESCAENAADENAIADLFIRDEEHRRLHAAIDALPAAQREAVHLVYFSGMSYDEAGAVLRKTRKQVDNLLTRAKKTLKSLLEEEPV